MNKILLAIILTGAPMVLKAQQPILLRNLDLEEVQFEQFAHTVENQTGIRFYYKDEWVSGIRVQLEADSMELTEAVVQVLKGTGLTFHIIPPDRLILLPTRSLTTDLSYLSGESEDFDRILQETKPGAKVSKFLTGNRPERIVQLITVGEKGSGQLKTAARIRGRIRDMESGEPIVGATMVVTENGKGCVSDQQGFFTISLLPGRYNVQFSYIGMEPYSCQLEVYSDGDFQVEMSTALIALNEVQIVGNHYRDINTADVGVERLTMNSVNKLPLFMGENDVIKISKLLPGITSAGEASVGVNVRGGSADQNIFYINRMPVYNTSHMFGFLSAFNSDIVQDFSVFKGNVPANYGGRLSSVFNILTRKGNQNAFTAHAGISPVTAHATVEGPIRKGKASYLVSARTSYSDWMLNRMEDPLLRDSKAYFYDITGAIRVTPNLQNDLNVFYYQSYDRFAYGNISQYNYANRGGSLNWKHNYSPALSSTMTLTHADYSFGDVESYEVSSAYNHQYKIRHSEFISEFEWVPALNHRFEFGGGLVFYNLDRGQVLPEGEQSLKIPVDLGTEKGLEGNMFISDDITLFPWLTIYAGLRYSFYSALGPEDVLLYEEGWPKTENTVTDTLHFSNLEPVSFHSGPEVRTAVNIKTGPNHSFKLSFSQMRQYLFMLSNTMTISPTDQWKLSDYHIAPPYGNQYSAGVYHIWPGWGLSGSVEIYYKHIKNVVDFKDGADFIGTPYTETTILQGTQTAYGVEFMLQRSSGRLDGWISYVYSRSMMQISKNDIESINRGEPYPSNFDRPHVLNLIWSYHLNRRITFSNNLVYMSGRPVTFPSSLYHINHIVYIDYYAKNQVRVPDYFRVDVSLALEGNLRADKRFHSSWSLNVYNLLGRNNPQSIFFKPRENYLEGYSFSVIGVPIVTISWNVKMGNYESN
jgi:hypothetical protein